MSQGTYKRWAIFVLLLSSVCWAGLGVAGSAQGNQIKLTLIHNNDGESRLINAGRGREEFGGVARFAAVVDRIRAEVDADPDLHVSLTVSSGDNTLAGAVFNASLDKGVPFFDSIALSRIGYNALDLGNHDFDFGPNTLADFIEGFTGSGPFLSANLDFSQEPRLQALVDNFRLAKSVVVFVDGEHFAIVGVTTPNLPFISSPGRVGVDPDVAGAIQREIDNLEANGINKIILISHLQSVEEDMALVPMLSGVDIVVAGGGDDLLANPGDLLIPGDEGDVVGPYPIMAARADGRPVPIVTSIGQYQYVGRLDVTFDANGEVISVGESSGPKRVASSAFPDGVDPDPFIQANVVDPVQAAVDELAARVIGISEVGLDARRDFIRSRETNEGDLVADSLLATAKELAGQFGAAQPDIAMTNGGGIRNDSIIPPGDFTELLTFNMLPFPNFVTIMEDVTPPEFKALLENAYSRIDANGNRSGSGTGRFAQISGFSVVYDSRLEPGSRVLQVMLDDGTVMVDNGAVAPTARNINITTVDFLARGGDQWDFGGRTPVILGRTYQRALSVFVQGPLGGVISAAQYPEGGEGRITNLALQ